MRNLVILSIIIAFCRLAIGDTSIGTCTSGASASTLDPKTGCCGIQTGDDKLLHGNSSTRIDEYPWLALIEYEKDGTLKTLCGGALISSKYVLSAANCVTGYALRMLQPKNIRLGEYDTQNEGPDCEVVTANEMDCNEGIVRIPIEKTIPHPEYVPENRNHWNDIALIRMEKMAPYTDFIRPICLPTTDMTLKTQPFYLVKAGWGQVHGLSNVKLQVGLPFVNQKKCQQVFSNIWKGQFCAGGEEGKDSCPGDSGMPLMFRNGERFEAIGIVSSGSNPCGKLDIPSIYTNIYEYKSWINNNIIA